MMVRGSGSVPVERQRATLEKLPLIGSPAPSLPCNIHPWPQRRHCARRPRGRGRPPIADLIEQDSGLGGSDPHAMAFRPFKKELARGEDAYARPLPLIWRAIPPAACGSGRNSIFKATWRCGVAGLESSEGRESPRRSWERPSRGRSPPAWRRGPDPLGPVGAAWPAAVALGGGPPRRGGRGPPGPRRSSRSRRGRSADSPS